MVRRRWGLVLLSVVSLVVLVYAGVFTAFSVTVSPTMESQARLPNETAPLTGQRALVFPVTDPTLIPTMAKPGPDGPVNGSLLLVGDPGASFPAGTPNASLLRALAFVAPTANRTYEPSNFTFSNLTFADGNVTSFENATVDVASLAGGKAGFLVKGDTARNVTFVPTEDVAGTVVRYDSAGLVWALFALGGIGFVAPIVVLIVTHRGAAAGRGGTAAAGVGGVCPECRSPLEPGATFCTRCGAWLDHKEGT